MLEDKPLKAISIFVFPIILGSILQNMYGMADTAIVGKFIGDSALAAVGATSLTFSVMISLSQGFMSGFSIIAGQKVGASDYEGLRKVYLNGFILVVILSVICTTFLTVFTDQLLVFMKTPPELMSEAKKYIRVIYFGTPATLLYNFFCEILRAIGNSKKPFYYLLIASALNIVLDLFFVCVLHTGVMGAALATVISQAVSAILCLINLNRSSWYFRLAPDDMKPDKSVIKQCARLGIPTATLNGVIQIGIITLQIFTNKFGVEYIAATSASARLAGFYNTPIWCFGAGLSVFVAQNFGARKYDRIKKALWSVMFLLCAYSTVMFGFSLLFSKYIIKLFISNTPLVAHWGNIVLNVSFTGHYALIFIVLTKSVLNALGRPLMSTLQGFADVALRVGIVYFGTRYFGFWGIAFGDNGTWIMGAVVFVFMLIYENRKIKKEHGFGIF